MRGRFKMYRSTVDGVEAVEAVTGQSFARHTHEQFGIGLIHHGAQKSLSGRGIVEAIAGDIITVNPNEVHDGMPIGEERAWRILYFDPKIFATLAAETAESSPRSEIPHPVVRDPRMAMRFHRLFEAVRDGTDALCRDELLLDLIAGILSEGTEMEEAAHLPEAVRRARSMIDDDPVSHVSLADLSSQTGLSRFQVLRAFSKATGMTPHAYLVQRRIHLARRLIARRMPLAEAALTSGFADQSHMTRVFVAKYGLSPRVYAKAFA